MAVTETTSGPLTAELGADDNTIRPFTFEAADADLEDLRARIAATRFPEKETVDDQSQGVQLATIKALAKYWLTEYDWRKCEARLNALPQFITEIDGLDIHFIHVRSKHEDALPLIVTHGWPGSVIEQLKIVDPLTNPTAHGASAADAFHLVIPSMPGYGFSGKPTTKGWGPDHIARAWVELMRRLGYSEFVAQGGDWGSVVTDLMAVDAPEGLLGIHVNMAGVIPPEIDTLFHKDIIGAVNALESLPADLSDEERAACERLHEVWTGGATYALSMASRPETLIALADSPVGQAVYLMDHDARSMALISRSFAGEPEGLTPDDVLDNATHFWLTNTMISAARLYAENTFSFFGVKGVSEKVPVAVSVFPDELYQAPKSWTEKAYSNLIHYNKLDKGGHFAAWEQPQLFCEEVRAGFRSLR
jgi:pimeloyl-ACP methyl ester carboxylesterase